MIEFLESLGLPTNATSTTTTIQFTAGGLGADDFQVAAYRGRESLSKCYSFDITLRAEPTLDDSTLESQLIGQQGCLTITTPTRTRSFYGIVCAMQIEGDRLAGDRWHLRVQLVPRVWLLRKRKNSRVFQNLTVHETVDKVLANFGISKRWDLRRAYPKREYCVQYDETDYHFVTRLLAEAGISFYFEQPSGDSDGLLNEAVDLAETAVTALSSGDLLGAATDAIADPLRQQSKEIMVFVDNTDTFPGIDDGPGSAATSLIDTAVSAGVDALGDAVGGVAGAAFNMVSDALSIRSVSPTLYYQHDAKNGEDFITDFSLARGVRAKAAKVQMFDPSTPSVQVVARANAGSPDVAANLSVGLGEDSDTLAGAAVSAALDVASAAVDAVSSAVGVNLSQFLPPQLEIFEHHHEYLKLQWPEEQIEGRRLLSQHRRKAWTAQGKSACARLAAGRRFTLDDHERATLNQEYLVTSIEHSGRVTWNEETNPASVPAYQNTFKAVPSFVPFVPKRPPRVIKQTCETATVVGPAGEEIHVNHLGQIRVQFHWDRYGTHNEHSSCWIRSLQNWSGPQYGTQFIPRVGTEVLVAFEGGDVDRPIVMGCVYHQTHPTPFELPRDKTRSGIRTHSSPGGHGFNELSFEDAKGHEQIYLHAEHDLDEVVRHNHTTKVGHDEIRTIAHDQTEAVHGDRTEHVMGADKYRVDGDQTIEIKGNRAVTFDSDDDVVVSGDASTTIAGSERKTVRRSTNYMMQDDHMVRVRGSYVTLVGRATAKRNYHLHVEGRTELAATDSIELTAEKSVVLRCGKSSIVVGPDQIELLSPTVLVSGNGAGLSCASGKVTLRGDSKVSVVAPQVAVQSSGGTLAMAGDIKLTSGAISLASGGGGSDSASSDSPKPTVINLKDQNGTPLAYQRFTVVAGDGSERGGITDEDGKAQMYIDGSAKILFSDLSKVAKG